MQEGQDPRIIELIRDYLRYFKVLSPEDIQNLIKFLRLSIYQRKTQQDSLRAEVISIFGNVVSGIETHENGIDAYIFVLQTLDGLTGSEIDLRNKILTHIRSWGITNTESAQNQFAILEQYLKLAGKFGVEMSSAELKRNIIETLLSSNQKLPMQLIAIATNHRINSSSTFEQMVLEFNQVSSPKVNDTEREIQADTTTSALQATNQASGANYESQKAVSLSLLLIFQFSARIEPCDLQKKRMHFLRARAVVDATMGILQSMKSVDFYRSVQEPARIYIWPI